MFTAVSLASLGGFYDAPSADKPFAAVKPSIWTSIAVHVSLITACLPALKRFLMDWAAGIPNELVGGTFELQYSSGSATRTAHASGLRNLGRSITRSHTRSRARSEQDTLYTSYVHGGKGERERTADDGDSRKGLTDGIWQTVDFQIDYREGLHLRNGSTDSNGKTRPRMT